MSPGSARAAPGRDTIGFVSKRRQRTPAEPQDRPEPRPPMSPAEVATAAYSLAILQAHDDTAGGVAARDAAIYEMLTLLCLESLAMLAGRDPCGFEHLLPASGSTPGCAVSSACTRLASVSGRRRSGKSSWLQLCTERAPAHAMKNRAKKRAKR